MAKGGIAEEDDGVSVRVKKDIGLLIANTGRSFNWCRDARIDDLIDLLSTTLAVLICQLFLPIHAEVSRFLFISLVATAHQRQHCYDWPVAIRPNNPGGCDT